MTQKKISKLIREDYPPNYSGYSFITLIQFNDEKFLSIVDRLTEKTINAYLLDLCGAKNVDESQILDVAYEWSESSRKNFPISFEFARLGLSDETSKLYRVFSVDFVERVIGPLPAVESFKTVVKRKKRKKLPKTQVVSR